MKIKHISILLMVSFVFYTKLNAQDNHYSHYENAPLYMNPAMTGVFIGDYRLVATWRQQWGKVLDQRLYKTAHLSFDKKLNVNCKDRNYFSFGCSFLGDEAAALHYQTVQISPSFSYQMNLGKTSHHQWTLALGSSLNLTHQRLDYTDARWSEQIPNGVFIPTLPANEPQFLADHKNRQTDIDPSVGALVVNRFNRYRFDAVYFGMAVHHLTRPGRSFVEIGRAHV